MKALGSAAVLVLLLTGCSAGAEEGESPAAPSSSPSAQAATLAEVCTQVSALLPPSTVPRKSELLEFQGRTETLRESADNEARAALDSMLASVQLALDAYEDPDEILPKLIVSEQWDGGVGTLRDQCDAAGSPL